MGTVVLMVQNFENILNKRKSKILFKVRKVNHFILLYHSFDLDTIFLTASICKIFPFLLSAFLGYIGSVLQI